MSSKSKTAKPAKPAKSGRTTARSAKPAKTAKPKASAAQRAARPARKSEAPRKREVAKKAPAAARKPAAAATHRAAPAAVRKVVETAPVAAAKSPVAAKPAAAPAKPPPPQAAAPHPPVQNGNESRVIPKKPAPRSEFKISEHIVYPAHGVGRIMGIETQEVAGIKLDLFVISFIKDKMTLRVPVAKATSVGMRKLADNPTVKRALETVRGRARIKRTMWSRRAQEYEAKINSGDLISIAEVVRDLYRSDTQPEQSYSERQLYEAALDRMSREISSVNRISETEAIRQIEQNLAKSPRRGAKTEAVDAAQEEAA